MASLKTMTAATLVSLAFAGTVSAAQVAVPHNPPAVPVTTFSQFQTGVYHYLEQNKSVFKVGKRQGNAYQLSTSFSKGTPKLFSYGGSRDHIVRNGQLIDPPVSNRLKAVTNNTVMLQRAGRNDGLIVRLEAYDVSGKPIASYLRNQANRSTKEAYRMNPNARFAQGSLAYVTYMQMSRPEVVIPSTEVITGQKNIDAFIKTFSGKIPNCLNYERRSGSQPYAIRFVNNKDNSGEIEIFHAKRGEVFCTADGPKIANGQYKVQTVNGTRVIALTFPNSVDSRDVGIRSNENQALQFAFVEVKKPRAQVLPGRIVHANREFTDNQFRFNSVAAQSIDQAM